MDEQVSRTAPTLPPSSFSGEWRDYQARLLREIDGHLENRKLHIVAAPGAGKTVLGLEVLRHLGRPALVLSPTLAIRDQWLDRLTLLFTPDGGSWPEGRSRSLAAPGWITSTTYQSLHVALGGSNGRIADDDEEAEDDLDETLEAAPAVAGFLEALVRAGVGTVVLDEAHHLRRAWWESLTQVIAHLEEHIPELHVLSLTATPPYDVEQAEWDRYVELCGPVDAEISIPELVKQGDLCPHQDFVHFSIASGHDVAAVETFASEAQALAAHWAADTALGECVATHPWLTAPKKHETEILAEPVGFGAVLVVAAANGIAVPASACRIIAADRWKLPPPDARGVAPLFQLVVDRHPAFNWPDLRKRLVSDLNVIGALSRGRVRLRRDDLVTRALTRGAAKLDSILDIAREESASLGEGLRLVVLTSYVRAEALAQPAARSTDRLGAGPILRHLIGNGLADALRPAMVTGSTVVVPEAVRAALVESAAVSGIAASEIALTPLPLLDGFCRFDLVAGRRELRLPIVTRLFESGVLRCLVGTAALMGEGWDAPSINSLILASSVKSYMSSNQMRGRAIRSNPAAPDKTAAIWHLATILPPGTELARSECRLAAFFRQEEDAPVRGGLNWGASPLGSDALVVLSRFRSFAGVSHDAPYVIQNGIRRLGIDARRWTDTTVRQFNGTMLVRARDRKAIRAAWQSAFDTNFRMARPTTSVRVERIPKGAVYIWRNGVLTLLAGFFGVACNILTFAKDVTMSIGMHITLLVAGVGLAVAAYWYRRQFWLLLRAGSPGRFLLGMAHAVLDGLDAAGALDTPRADLKPGIFADDWPPWFSRARRMTLFGGSHMDEDTFADAMAQLLGPVENPRHILVRSSRFLFFVQTDFHAVPARISANAKAVLAFRESWERRVGRCQVLPVRNRQGRVLLLRARARSFASAFQERPERLTVWE